MMGVALGTEIIPMKLPQSVRREIRLIFLNAMEAACLLQPAKPDEYVRCFNFANLGRAADNFTNKFYCGYGPNGDLSIQKAILKNFMEGFAHQADHDLRKITAPPNYYGYCEFPPTGSAPMIQTRVTRSALLFGVLPRPSNADESL
jgi:hypothetical protein